MSGEKHWIIIVGGAADNNAREVCPSSRAKCGPHHCFGIVTSTLFTLIVIQIDYWRQSQLAPTE